MIMKQRSRRIRMSVLVFLLVAATFGLVGTVPQTHAAGTTYYVDSASGSDTNTGTSPGAAWQTLTKVNATTFSPGDQILFKRGGVWHGQLHPLGSGALVGGVPTPITIGAYDTGSRPIINGGSLASGAAVYLRNQQYWVIQDLEVTNDSGIDNETGAPRYGILVKGESAGQKLNFIRIKNNYVHNVNGCFDCSASNLDAHINGGIIVFASPEGDSFGDVVIEDNTGSDLGRNGITAWDYTWTSTPVNPQIDNWNTKVVSVDNNKVSTGLVIQNNNVSLAEGDSILVLGFKDSLIQYNVSNGAGQHMIPGGPMNASAGIWPAQGSGTVVQYNESYGTKLNDTDGQGFDIDIGHTNGLMQYNYSHDNEGGFLLMMDIYASQNTIRYNLSVNDGAGGQKGLITFAMGLPDQTHIYNNTFYIGENSAANPIYCDLCPGTNPGTWSFKNNIVYNLGSGEYYRPPANAGTFDYNVFYGNHPASEPADAHKLTSDPLLVNPGASGTGLAAAADYMLQTGSPALYSGVLVPGNGGQDYFGNPVSSLAAPSRGFYEGPDIPVVSSFTDPASNWDYTYSRTASSNWRLDATNPSYFSGDTSRFTRNTTATASIVYNLSDVRQFSAKIYYFFIDMSKVKFYTSPDGITWTVAPSSYSTPVSTSAGWKYTYYTPNADLPAGTNYLKMEFSDTTSGYGTQLSEIYLTQ